MQSAFINVFMPPIIYKLAKIIFFIIKYDLKIFYSINDCIKKILHESSILNT